MIPQDEFRQLAISQGVPLPYVEKDYVLGWLLWGISRSPDTRQNLILKGGNCLRKLYFADTRFSDDLDFTAIRIPSPGQFRETLNDVCATVSEASGIPFDLDKTIANAIQTPDPDSRALDARVYFTGLAGDSSLLMRIKFDISEFEKVLLPLQWHPIIHPYSDASALEALVQAYSLEEVLAEKLRSWIQRTRARDLFDVVKIVHSGAIPITPSNIMSAFFRKTLFKDLPLAGRDELLFEPKFAAIQSSWLDTIVTPANAIIVAGNAITLFKNFVNALFSPEVLSTIGVTLGTSLRQLYAASSGYREAIIKAGRARRLIRLHYHGITRTIEPYSFRFKWTKKGAAEYFYGFDRTRGQTIKSFFLHEISAVSILPEEFIPRWVVEF